MRPLGATSSEITCEGRSRTRIGPASKPVRAAFRSKRRILPSFTAPTNRSPANDGPKPQPSQKASPVSPTVAANVYFGRILGAGPLLFVFGQLWLGPHPWFPPFTMRLTSSLQLGPFSDSHR